MAEPGRRPRSAEPRTRGHAAPGQGSGPHGRKAWTRRLLGLCLLAWPAHHRRARGAQLLDTALALVAERRPRGPWAVAVDLAGEALGLLTAGLALRREAAARQLRAGVGDAAGDARVALRVLRRTPGFTSVAIMMLALGMGANGAVFSLVDSVLLRPPPYERPEDLVVIWGRLSGSGDRVPLSAPDVAVLAERQQAVAPLAFSARGTDGSIELPGADAARHARIAAVSPGFFQVLGVQAALGRALDARDGPSAATDTDVPRAVLAHGAWRAMFGSDPGIVGREARLNGLPVVVVGVMPADFRLMVSPDAGVLTDVDIWVPLPVPLRALRRLDDRVVDQDSDNTGVVVGRLAAGVDLGRAAEEVDGVAAELREEVPAHAAADLQLDVRRLHEDAIAHARPLLVALMVGVGTLLLVACLNLAGLLSSKGRTRAREIAVRSALGASRQRLVRQLVVEGAVLVGSGFALAVPTAIGLTTLLRRLAPQGLFVPSGPLLRPTILVFAAMVVGVVVVLVAVLPAVQGGSASARGALGGTSGLGASRGAARRSLVVAQIGLSVVLVLSAGLLLRTVSELERTHPGFVADHALTFRVSLREPGRYDGPAERARYMKEVEQRIRTVPGVRSAGVVGVLPLGGGRWTQPYGLPGQPEWEWQGNRADFRVITSGYLPAIGARLVEGRAFTEEEDLEENERVVVVDRLLARRIAPQGSAVDATISVPVDGAFVKARVVGVVEHIRYDRLEADGRETIYVPYRQEASREVSFVVRSIGDPSALAPAVRDAAREVDARVPIYDLRTLSDYIDQAIAPRRLALTLLTGFAFLGLASVVVGLYGVVAFDVSRRTREIGLRMALGAGRWEVVASVLASSARMTAVGLAVGAVLGAGAAPLLGALLHGVGGADPTAWIGGIALVAGAALLASVVPAARAISLSPTEALRSD